MSVFAVTGLIVLGFILFVAFMVYATASYHTCDWCGRQKNEFKMEFHQKDIYVCKACVKRLRIYTFREYERYKKAQEKAEKTLEEDV